MKSNLFFESLKNLIQLLRWNKPSGRLILLIPAGWALWLTPTAPPDKELVALIVSGGLFVSGAGCITNDLWDRKIDQKVERTKHRPLASGNVKISTALVLLSIMLVASFCIVLLLPISSRDLCLKLALMALVPILIYPSSKRWFDYPQAFLSICWGFAVLIPWAASESNLILTWPLTCCWSATLIWTFGFDTVYAMADSKYDRKLGLKSSVISLGERANQIVGICYACTCFLIAIAAITSKVGLIFWPIFICVAIGMQREVWILKNVNNSSTGFSKHFQNQVLLGSLLLFGLILSRISY